MIHTVIQEHRHGHIIHAIIEDVAVNFLWPLLDSKKHITSLLAELAKLLRIYSMGKKMMGGIQRNYKGTLKAKKETHEEG